ncbi:hypothetical protein COW36_07290 [bacterium (Candidatus Blackallbacteria) CG17_big_fil_post_rev_8_21_14_2_50_48_46]|uniref:Uncharacterized protein n=1 Tax=bacterium (Candidatus Blackallbacteria) CG17_big_fil_post_rev_8_21_14_2_50_48_46 TaxID=2014261 RepID=A0A2M7G740_9BACT|nr:MAG: hypothetical protein COW64_06800 [bacterium (Candidatus Blackallbacteria) CG18_big_fil_WC_8_21_14_2_50_49_26]PIW17866.1 MAG: hypothetical protein COW36_07290 [bacterium (Candidatus Blackallbacteria) CG17_big_fil_post_rev_8_21_14_2_50_48_46]PIW48542.1 MAG: hypothetical protein COW20_09245 [bacterium (Candidatus Blackallbacteria) CG13_big_fil_rev_8_21_14_2_50_49_14]
MEYFGSENTRVIPLLPEKIAPVTASVFQVSPNPNHRGALRVMIGSASGFQVQKTQAQVQNIKLYLLSSNSGLQSPIYASPLIAKTAATQVFTFQNIDSGSYYVAASAYDFGGVNITDSQSPDNLQVTDGGVQNAYVSSGGGESAFPGRVTVTALTHALADPPTLSINLRLVAGP